jgi:hypothetical protein
MINTIETACRALALAAAIACGSTLAAEPDRSVKRQLDALKLAYSVDESGDFQLTFDLGNGRSQLAIVRSATLAYGSLEIRELLSIGHFGDPAGFPAPVANRLLEHNNGAKLGAWVKQGGYAMFVSRIAADAGRDELKDALEATVRLADEIERELDPKQDKY